MTENLFCSPQDQTGGQDVGCEDYICSIDARKIAHKNNDIVKLGESN